ncbi:MAG: hypothetical protein GX752_02455 [Clostridium sp.]|nr:hypothetical protein [Clostridium sp.]
MKLYIKQSVFTLKDKFTVKNEEGQDVFYVDGSFFRIPKQFKVYDKNQNEVASIDRQMFRLFGSYDIVTENSQITLRRQFSLFRQSYILEGINWYLQGNFTGHHYEVIEGESLVMKLRKHWFTWGDSYELSIPDDQDALLALCIAICIDYEILKDQNSSNS